MSIEKTAVKLWAGTTMPRIGLGTLIMWEKSGGTEDVEIAVKASINAGYRHFDTAYFYQTEGAVGAAINAKIADGTIKREDVFVTSKLFCTHMRQGRVVSQLKTALTTFGLDYLDMYLIHWPLPFKELQDESDLFSRILSKDGSIEADPDVDYVDTWKGMEEAVDLGLTKAIGLSNFNHKQIGRVWEMARIKPSCLQVEVNPYFTNAKLIDFCHQKYPDMAIVAYAPFGNPSRTWRGPEDPPSLLDNEKLIEIAKVKGKTVAQIIIRWLLQRDLAVIPKSVTPSRIKENIQVFDFDLTEGEMSSISSLNINFRTYDGRETVGHPHWPFHEEF